MAIEKVRKPILSESDINSESSVLVGEKELDEKIKAKMRDNKQGSILGLTTKIGNRDIKLDERELRR